MIISIEAILVSLLISPLSYNKPDGRALQAKGRCDLIFQNSADKKKNETIPPGLPKTTKVGGLVDGCVIYKILSLLPLSEGG
jgi:hypothetical protein